MRTIIKPITIVLKSWDSLCNDIIKNVNTVQDEIPNKYLFVGHQGASLWQQIDIKYTAGTNGRELIQHFFKDINKILLKDNQVSYDIISLGVGLGGDDIEILREIETQNKGKDKPFRIYTIDLSPNLLDFGTGEIAKHLNGYDISEEMKNNIESFYAIWADFKDFRTVKSTLKKDYKLGQRRALYHLLGLTLGNNRETDLLKSIHTLMNDGDFLLIEVDFSVDFGQNAIDEAEKIYTQYDAAIDINKFLCVPLHFVSNYKEIGNMKHHDEDETARYYQQKYQITNIFKDVYIRHCQESRISNVDNAVSLVRRHFCKTTEPRICDFSTKYESNSFEKYIKQILVKDNVFFNWENCYKFPEEHKNKQALVLLRKMNQKEAKEKQTKRTIPVGQQDGSKDLNKIQQKILEKILACLGGEIDRATKSDLEKIRAKLLLNTDNVLNIEYLLADNVIITTTEINKIKEILKIP